MNKEENNQLVIIQSMLMNQMKRLDDNKIMKQEGDKEIRRGNALSNNACTYIKSVNTGIRIIDMAAKTEKNINDLEKELGVRND